MSSGAIQWKAFSNIRNIKTFKNLKFERRYLQGCEGLKPLLSLSPREEQSSAVLRVVFRGLPPTETQFLSFFSLFDKKIHISISFSGSTISYFSGLLWQRKSLERFMLAESFCDHCRCTNPDILPLLKEWKFHLKICSNLTK